MGLSGCPKADSCLRVIEAKLVVESEDAQPATINTANAIYMEQLADQGSCPLFRSSKPLRYAKGITRLFNDITIKQTGYVRNQVIACFSSERYFYHSRKGSRLIDPKEQQKTINIFRNSAPGVEPKFDGYEYVIEW